MAWVTGLYLVYLLLPMALLVVGAFGEVWTNTLLPAGVTAKWFAQVAGDPSFRRAFTTSLWVTAATGAAATFIGLPLAYALHRARSPALRLGGRLLALLPVAVPPLVLAFGFILVFSSDTLPFLGTGWVMVGGLTALTLPYVVQTLAADMRHLDLDALERAAESLGAGRTAIFFEVVVPTLRHSLAAALAVVGAIALGEFQLVNLIAGFLNRPYPVVLLQAFYGATGFACAATVVLLVLALLMALATAATQRGVRALGMAGG
jgi:putative spermidine/putrescine transport system permease protein